MRACVLLPRRVARSRSTTPRRAPSPVPVPVPARVWARTRADNRCDDDAVQQQQQQQLTASTTENLPRSSHTVRHATVHAVRREARSVGVDGPGVAPGARAPTRLGHRVTHWHTYGVAVLICMYLVYLSCVLASGAHAAVL